MKVLGLDVGTKRIGVARADSSVKIAVPQCTISVDGTEFAQISRLTRVYNTKFFVIGLPRGAQGQETAQSRYSREFAKKLKIAIPGAKVCFQDESLTSVEAEKRLKNRKKGYQKGDIDAEAATIILQDFIENLTKSRASQPTSGASSASSPHKPANSPHKKPQNSPRRTKKREGRKKILSAVIVALSGICIILLGLCIFNGSLASVVDKKVCSSEELIAKNPDSCKKYSVTIKEGSSITDIAALLKEKDLISSPLSFGLYAKFFGPSSGLKAGTYDLQKTLSSKEIIALMSDGSAGVSTFTLTTLPGGTLNDFKETLLDNGYSEEEINTALSKPYDNPVLSSKPADASLEGYIFGETIEVTKGDSVESIIESLLKELNLAVLNEGLEEKFSAKGLSLHQGIILASIVQKESKPEHMPDVASVFYNRMEAGMNLGSDVTATYSADLLDPNRRIYTTNTDILSIDSCYNTRIYAGLPCGPISNPGLPALRATAEPSDTPYLYFLTGDDGMMYYSTTDSGHLSNISAHCQELCTTSL